MLTDFTLGLAIGATVVAAVSLALRSYQTVKALSAFASDDVMTHDMLLADVMQMTPLVSLTSLQASQLVDAYALQQEHFTEAMTRNSELHQELAQVKHVANKSALEAAHARACCDELRAKLHAVNVEYKMLEMKIEEGLN